MMIMENNKPNEFQPSLIHDRVAPVRKKKRNPAKGASKIRTRQSADRQPTDKNRNNSAQKNNHAIGSQASIEHSVLNIPLNPNTARQAIILSEIIGKPISKRGRHR